MFGLSPPAPAVGSPTFAVSLADGWRLILKNRMADAMSRWARGGPLSERSQSDHFSERRVQYDEVCYVS